MPNWRQEFRNFEPPHRVRQSSQLWSYFVLLVESCYEREMHVKDPNLRRVWSQRQVPVVLRRSGKGELLRGRLHGPLEFNVEDLRWIRDGRRIIPSWDRRGCYWEFPKKWFNDFVERAIREFGAVWIIQPFRETEVCARACMEATGHECQCSCMGTNHGSGMHGHWFEVTESFAVRATSPQLAARLLRRI